MSDVDGEQQMKTATMKRKDLAAWMRKVADAVESGDSAEGRIQWSFDYENDDSAPDDVAVEAFVREGNLDGQGSAIIIGGGA